MLGGTEGFDTDPRRGRRGVQARHGGTAAESASIGESAAGREERVQASASPGSRTAVAASIGKGAARGGEGSREQHGRGGEMQRAGSARTV